VLPAQDDNSFSIRRMTLPRESKAGGDIGLHLGQDSSPDSIIRLPDCGGPTMEAPRIANPSFELNAQGVHVWSVGTEVSEANARRLGRLLALDERNRAARFRFDEVRHSFIVARGALRILLGRYLNASPVGVQFKYGFNGKPALESALRPIEFNTSHSGGLVMLAFTIGCEIGIDLEHIRPIQGMQGIADRFFCEEEAMELALLSVEQRQRAFFLCWSRKEAHIKAIGSGLSTPLNSFRVTTHPSQPARLIYCAHEASDANEWTLHDLQVDSRYVAALAYRGAERTVTAFPLIHSAELLKIAEPNIPCI